MNNAEKIPSYIASLSTNWISVKGLRKLFNVGDTKARKMMASLPYVRIGRTQYVLYEDLVKYIKDNKGINVCWD